MSEVITHLLDTNLRDRQALRQLCLILQDKDKSGLLDQLGYLTQDQMDALCDLSTELLNDEVEE